jgi:GT2 family glycosyltransferase
MEYPDSYERFNLKYDKVTVPVMYGNIWDHCMSQEFPVSVIAVNHQRAGCLDNWLWSALRQKTDFNFEIVVVDDASTDGVEDMLLNNYEDLLRSRRMKYIKNCTRLGPYKPFLIGAAAADGLTLILTQSEMIPPQDFSFQRLVDNLTDDTIATFAQECRILNRDAEALERDNWRDNPLSLLDFKYQGKLYGKAPSEPWFLLGAIRYQDFRELTIKVKYPCMDSPLGGLLMNHEKQIKWVEDVIIFHTKHVPHSEDKAKRWWIHGKFPA